MKKIIKNVGIVVILALAVYGAYSLSLKVTSYIRYQNQYYSIEKVENMKNGVTPIPDIMLTSPNGNKISIYDELKKKDFVIVSFGSIYCENCHKEYRMLESDKMLGKVPGNAEMFVAVPEGREFITQFEKDLDIHIPLYVMSRNVPKQLGIAKIPTIILLGKDKKIKMYQTGFKEEGLKEIFDYINQNGN